MGEVERRLRLAIQEGKRPFDVIYALFFTGDELREINAQTDSNQEVHE